MIKIDGLFEREAIVRSCGECTVCCKTHDIASLAKPQNVLCTHCRINVGCTIYEARPDECRAYTCEWLRGTLSKEDRPDMSGIVVDVAATADRTEAYVRLIESDRGCLNLDCIQQFIRENVAKGIPVKCVPIGKPAYWILPKEGLGPQLTKAIKIVPAE